jgi:hypothetical protein
MCSHVALLRTDEGEKISKLVTTLAPVLKRATRRQIPEDCILCGDRRENLNLTMLLSLHQSANKKLCDKGSKQIL